MIRSSSKNPKSYCYRTKGYVYVCVCVYVYIYIYIHGASILLGTFSGGDFVYKSPQITLASEGFCTNIRGRCGKFKGLGRTSRVFAVSRPHTLFIFLCCSLSLFSLSSLSISISISIYPLTHLQSLPLFAPLGPGPHPQG